MGGTDKNLGDSLRALGYDIVILNYPANKYVEFAFPVYPSSHSHLPPHYPAPAPDTIKIYRDGGTDYIQRNAFILVKLLQDLKSQLPTGSNYKFAVIGPSMGGLITRYALSYMEKNGLDHNTCLWLSFDAPHHGANIPLGLQDMFRYMADKLNNQSAKDVMNTQLRRPAARQMLISQTTGNSADLPNYIHNAAPDRVHWMNDLNAIGFPQNVRRISLVNGKGSGGVYHTPGSEMFTIEGYLAANPHNAALEATPYFMNPTYSKIVHVWKLFKKAYNLWGSFTMAYGPLDGVQGGMYDVQEDVYTPTEGSHDTALFKSWGSRFYTPFVSTAYITNKTHNMSFIPTVSGLALNNPNINWSQPIDVASLVCDNKTPFHNIFVPEENENHVTITAKNAPWIIEEITDGQPGCPVICSRSITGGVERLCEDATETYYLDATIPVASGFTTTWSVGPDVEI